MKRWVLPVAAIALIFVSSCYYDNEEALYPSLSSSCDTSNVTFSFTIVQVLRDNCYSCHSNLTAASSGNSVFLENYSDLKAKATAVSGSIKHASGYSPMPKNGGKLKDCSIKQWDIWVRNGMLNN